MYRNDKGYVGHLVYRTDVATTKNSTTAEDSFENLFIMHTTKKTWQESQVQFNA